MANARASTRSRWRPMSMFGAASRPSPTPAAAITTIHIGDPEPTNLYVGTSTEGSSRMIFYMVSECNRENITNLELCSNVCSIMACVWPEIKDTAKIALQNQDAEVNVVKENANGTFNGVEGLYNSMTQQQILIILGQCILLLYKKVGDNNYEQFMTNRIRAMMAHIDLVEGRPITVFLKKPKAGVVRSMLGSEVGLRKKVLDFIINLCDVPSPIGRMCRHLSQIIAWTDMAGFRSIMDAFDRTNSPVLYDLRVAAEVMRFRQAANELKGYPFPQYFRIREPPSRTNKLERSNFPILITVAQLAQGTSRQFMTPAAVSNPVVIDLLRIHTRFISARNGTTTFQDTLRRVVDFSSDQLQE